MASIGTISLSNASIGNISNISVKINGDPTERFISFNPSSGVITFDSLDDGFRYSYVLLIEFDDQRIASAIFSHGCGEISTTEAPVTCTLPSSINILGNTSPEIQSEEVYSLSITGGSNNTYSWVVIGGTISGSSTSNTVTVNWGISTSEQSSISVAVGCSGGDSITDTESFTLQNPVIVDCVIADSVSISGSNNVVAGSTVSYSATVIGGYNNDLSWSVIGGTIIGSSTGSSVNIQWGTDIISQSSVTVTASCLGQSVSDIDTITIIEEGTTSTTAAPTCILPSSVSIIGDLSPLVNTEDVYSMSIPGGQNNTYSWSVMGGTIIGSSTQNSVTIQWGSDTQNQSSVTGTVFCGQESIFRTEAFTLRNETVPFIQLAIDSQGYLTSNEACISFEAGVSIYRSNNGSSLATGVAVFQESTLTNPYVPTNTSSWYLLQEGVTRYAVQIDSFGTISQLIAC